MTLKQAYKQAKRVFKRSDNASCCCGAYETECSWIFGFAEFRLKKPEHDAKGGENVIGLKGYFPIKYGGIIAVEIGKDGIGGQIYFSGDFLEFKKYTDTFVLKEIKPNELFPLSKLVKESWGDNSL